MTAVPASIDRYGFLRRVLGVDAATCVVMAVLLSLGSDLLAGVLELPRLLLELAGLSLFPIAAFIAWVAARRSLSRSNVWIVIVGNVLWVLGSVVLLFSDSLSPSVLGYAFVIAQAATVALLAELEYVGLSKAAPTTGSSLLHS